MSLELTRELYLVTCKEILTVYLGSVGRSFLKAFFSHSRKLFSKFPLKIFVIVLHDITKFLIVFPPIII